MQGHRFIKAEEAILARRVFPGHAALLEKGYHEES